MSSVQRLREFICARLTAAAEEIFSEVEKTIEEEMDRQRRLLEISWSPQIKLPTAEVPNQSVCKMDVQDEQLLWNHKFSSLDQETPESVHIKEEQEELLTSQEGLQLLMKDETDSFSLTPTPVEIYHSDQVSSYASPVDRHSQLEGSDLEDSGPASHERHETVHTHEKQYACITCGKRFKDRSKLTVHARTHTGEKPYSCQTCGKCFSQNSTMVRHMRTHTGEKPYSCESCGKSFTRNSQLSEHMRSHTGEMKPHSCEICGRCFNKTSQLLRHEKFHKDENPLSCKICGKCFYLYGNLSRHMKIHIGEKPYS